MQLRQKIVVKSRKNHLIWVFFVALTTVCLTGFSTGAQSIHELRVKFSQQDTHMRIVLEGEDSYINSANITTSGPLIRIGFPGPFMLKTEKALPIELISQDKALTVNLKEQYEVKFFRLSTPARLVFDIQKGGTAVEKRVAGNRTDLVVLDAGHGGYDFGITKGGTSEKDLTLNITKELARGLSKQGRKVLFMRKVDQFISLRERIDFVNQKKPGIFISLHVSRFPHFALYSPLFDEMEPRDLEEAYRIDAKQRNFLKKSKMLAESLKKALHDEYSEEITLREMPLPILNAVGAPAVCIEIPSPEFIVYDDKARERIVNAIVHSLLLYEP